MMNFHMRGGRRLYYLANHLPGFLEKLFAAEPGFGNDLDGAVFERLERALSTFFSKARTDHHWDRVLTHDLLQEGQAIHMRHLDIQRDDIRYLFGDSIRRYERIGCSSHDLN